MSIYCICVYLLYKNGLIEIGREASRFMIIVTLKKLNILHDSLYLIQIVHIKLLTY